MTSITLSALRKTYGSSTVAVDSISLRIDDGELFFLLGPSGCGKTTLLRMIAGFIAPTGGRLQFDGEDVTDLPPEKRHTGMVFQNYALWPHMSVTDNVGFGLKVRKGLSRPERRDRIAEALKAVHMQDYAKRKPNQLSGGQQQRVALARALVVRPKVLLLDEPLSNLDARLRAEMRSEIRRLVNETGITTLYVTHDQKEALSMADGLAVLREGKVEQIGSPMDVYQRPRNRFVADFLGDTNFLSAEVKDASGGMLLLDAPMGPVVSTAFHDDTPRSGNLTCSIRPESWMIQKMGGGSSNDLANSRENKSQPARRNRWCGKVLETIYLGEVAQHEVELTGDTKVRVFEMNAHNLRTGEEVWLSVDPTDVVVLGD